MDQILDYTVEDADAKGPRKTKLPPFALAANTKFGF